MIKMLMFALGIAWLVVSISEPKGPEKESARILSGIWLAASMARREDKKEIQK